MIGNPGTGKSHLATALAAVACQRGYRVRFFRTTELVTALIEARDERSFLRLKAQLARLDLLVLDELGYVPAVACQSQGTTPLPEAWDHLAPRNDRLAR